MKVLTQKKVGLLIGRISGNFTAESELLLGHIEALEAILDEADQDDMFGTEGWRHRYEGTDPRE